MNDADHIQKSECGYCGDETDLPCTDGKQAMTCSKDIKQPKKIKTLADEKNFWIAVDAMDRHNDEKASRKLEGRKDDTNKVRFDLLPPELLFAVATILTSGAIKYSDRNWEQGMSWGRVFGACMRHMWAWWSGDKADDETGHSHLWHAGCCIAFLIAYEERGIGEDDRNKDTIK